MGIRSSAQSRALGIDTYIGTAYDKVAIVADSIEIVKSLETNLPTIQKYLGAFSTQPTIRPNGSVLQDGDYYLNTSTDIIEYYDLTGTTWVSVDTNLVLANAIRAETAAGLSEDSAVASEVSRQASETQAVIATVKANEASVSALAAANSVASVGQVVDDVNANTLAIDTNTDIIDTLTDSVDTNTLNITELNTLFNFDSIKTSSFTAEPKKMYMVNALSTTIVITLPTLSEGDTLVFHSLNTSTQNVQIDNTGVEVVGVGGTIAAGDNLELTAGQSVQLVAVSATELTLVGGVV